MSEGSMAHEGVVDAPARPKRPVVGGALLVVGAAVSIVSRFLDWGTYVDPTGQIDPVHFVGDEAAFAGLFLAAGIGVLVMVAMMVVIPRYVKLWAAFAFALGLGSLQGVLFVTSQANGQPGLTLTWTLNLVIVAVAVMLVGSVLAFFRR